MTYYALSIPAAVTPTAAPIARPRTMVLGLVADRWTPLRTPVDDLDRALFDELLEPGIFGVPG